MTDADLLEYIQCALDNYGDDGDPSPTCAGHFLGSNDPPKGQSLKVVLWEEKRFIAANCDIGLSTDAEYEITVRRIK